MQTLPLGQQRLANLQKRLDNGGKAPAARRELLDASGERPLSERADIQPETAQQAANAVVDVTQLSDQQLAGSQQCSKLLVELRLQMNGPEPAGVDHLGYGLRIGPIRLAWRRPGRCRQLSRLEQNHRQPCRLQPRMKPQRDRPSLEANGWMDGVLRTPSIHPRSRPNFIVSAHAATAEARIEKVPELVSRPHARHFVRCSPSIKGVTPKKLSNAFFAPGVLMERCLSPTSRLPTTTVTSHKEERALPTHLPSSTLASILSPVELLALPPRSFLIPGLLPEPGLAVLYGAPGEGKSFLTLALPLSVAHARPCFGHVPEQGDVAILAAEGTFGLRDRVAAWYAHMEITPDDAPVHIIPASLDLTKAEAVAGLSDALDARLCGRPLKLLVIDTLSQCIPATDENSQAAMSAVVSNVMSIIERHRCLVMLVHHQGKSGPGMRGSSVLPAAADTIIHVRSSRSGFDWRLEILTQKQKDGQSMLRFTAQMRMKQIFSASVERTVPVACIEAPSGEPIAQDQDSWLTGPKLSKNQAAVLDFLLRRGGEIEVTEWRKGVIAAKLLQGQRPDHAFKSAVSALINAGHIIEDGTICRIANGDDLD